MVAPRCAGAPAGQPWRAALQRAFADGMSKLLYVWLCAVYSYASYEVSLRCLAGSTVVRMICAARARRVTGHIALGRSWRRGRAGQRARGAAARSRPARHGTDPPWRRQTA